MGLIERTARAICESGGKDPDEISKNWIPGQAYWTGYIPQAKASIQAIIDAEWPEESMIVNHTCTGTAKDLLRQALTE